MFCAKTVTKNAALKHFQNRELFLCDLLGYFVKPKGLLETVGLMVGGTRGGEEGEVFGY